MTSFHEPVRGHELNGENLQMSRGSTALARKRGASGQITGLELPILTVDETRS
jgi:hypothetical protein